MKLNTLKPAPGSRSNRDRVGRGIGSGKGKTCGRGHKGQKARTGGSVAPGFEGGQNPLYRRLPKVGFSSRVGKRSAQIRTSELNKITADTIDLVVLRKKGLINSNIDQVKVFLSGEVTKPLILHGLTVSAGAKVAIEAAGGEIR